MTIVVYHSYPPCVTHIYSFIQDATAHPDMIEGTQKLFTINALPPKGIYIEANDFMNLDDRAEQKLKRLKRRNFVAKNNKHRAKQHASLKQYTRRPKYQGSLRES